MHHRKLLSGIVAAFCLAAPALCVAAEKPFYIGDFKAETTQSDASDRAVHKSEENAAALSEALVRELNGRGATAYRLKDQDPAPQEGRVVSGVFSENVPHGLFSGISSIGSSTPNTDVKISIADAAGDVSKPVSTIDIAATLSGQGSSLSFNPYVLAAKFVVHQVSSDRSINDLARRIADQILAQRA